MRTDEDLATIVTVIYLGMAVPVVFALQFHDLLDLYLTGLQFTLLGAFVYGVVFWHLIARNSLDRVNVVLASVVFPVLGAMVILFIGVSMTDLHDGFRYLFAGFGDLFGYAVIFGLAGSLAAIIDLAFERHDLTPNQGPSSQTASLVLIALLLLGIIAGGTIGHVTARTAEVTAVAPDTTDHGRPVLNVTVDGGPAELRLTVTAPDDSTTTHRITRTELRGGSVTIPIEFWEFDAPEPPAGTYHVKLTSVPGMTVDTASHTIETAPTPSLVDSASAPPGDEFELGLPADAIVYGPKYDDETRVAVVLQNEGGVAARFYVRIYTDDERIKSREIPLEPGQHGANIFELSDDEVDRIHENADGTVSIEIVYGDHVIKTEVDLPET